MTTQLPSPLEAYSNLQEPARDSAIERFILNCGLAPHLLQWVPVEISRSGVSATIYVSPDYIGVTTPTGHFRTPLSAPALQRIADHYGAALPTARVVYALYYAPGAVRVAFVGQTPVHGETRACNRLWVSSNEGIETRRAGRTGLLVGHKKDIVVGPTQVSRPDRLAIFGAWGSDGKMIQGLNVTDHYIGYTDYSQCGRLVKPVVTLNGQDWDMAEVYKHPTYRDILTGEPGTLTGTPRYHF